MLRASKKVVRSVLSWAFPIAAKRRSELDYWKARKSVEATLSNSHYEPLYTEAFGLSRDDFVGKAILDIGCGPRGSLEWATMARQRVGLDPLADEYLKLGARAHHMEYVSAPSESVPFPGGYFDFVTCLNALDHVDNFDKTVAEIKRVVKPNGMFLLSVEIDHPPTATEPLTLSVDKLSAFAPEFRTTSERKVGTPDDHSVHDAVLSGKPPYIAGQPGIYIAKMVRQLNSREQTTK